jgi:hypothetical protein
VNSTRNEKRVTHIPLISEDFRKEIFTFYHEIFFSFFWNAENFVSQLLRGFLLSLEEKNCLPIAGEKQIYIFFGDKLASLGTQRVIVSVHSVEKEGERTFKSAYNVFSGKLV